MKGDIKGRKVMKSEEKGCARWKCDQRESKHKVKRQGAVAQGKN